MPIENLLPLLLVCASMVWTPGPNNALLASSGARFGFWPTLPHMLGVALGFALMVFAMGFGLGEIFHGVPVIVEILRWIGVAVLLWLAWKILNAPMPGDTGRGAGRPWRFYQAVIFQWINPKAWVMAISVLSQFVSGRMPVLEAAVCALVFLLVGLTSASGWAAFGATLQLWLRTPIRLRLFNAAMAALLIVTVAGLLVADFRPS